MAASQLPGQLQRPAGQLASWPASQPAAWPARSCSRQLAQQLAAL